MHFALAALRCCAFLVYTLVVGGLLAWAANPANPDPTATALYGIVLGIAVAWLGSAEWPRKKERWTIRLQATAIGLGILGLAHTTGGPEVASAGLLVMLTAVLFLWACHWIAQLLYNIQGGLVTVNGYAGVDAARHILYFASFSVPIALVFAPGPIGIGFIAVTGFVVGSVVTRRARRRLTNGLAREAA